MKFAFSALIIQTEVNEGKERENEYVENFIKQDVDDMIFGSTKQIISEREIRCIDHAKRGFFVFIAGKAKKGRFHGNFRPERRIFLAFARCV